MPWLVLFVILLAFLYLRKFRIAVLVLAGGVVLFSVGLWIYLHSTAEHPQETEHPLPVATPVVNPGAPDATPVPIQPDPVPQEITRPLVRPDELEFTDLVLTVPGGFVVSKLSGRVKNNSAHPVVGVTARITLLDCDQDNKCDVIGETDQNIAPVIPAGQARDFFEHPDFRGATVRGRMDWKYTITEVQARD